MPLSMATVGKENSIRAIRGRDDVKRFLNNLGFVVGGGVTVVCENGGNLIVNVKDARIAISKTMANRIEVDA